MAEARSVDDVVRRFGPEARARLRPHFERAGVPYPPRRVWLVAFKEERRLELWAGAREPRHVVDYAIQAASGHAGPKRRQGDLQVPEGLYRILHLNPNSSYHLSMKLDYPNAFDRANARRDGRTDLGGDIFIHGRAASIGCLAMGDPVAEELFVLAAEVGVANMQAVIAPHDLRVRPAVLGDRPDPAWLPELYAAIAAELRRFPRR
jgi:hypothetical protein